MGQPGGDRPGGDGPVGWPGGDGPGGPGGLADVGGTGDDRTEVLPAVAAPEEPGEALPAVATVEEPAAPAPGPAAVEAPRVDPTRAMVGGALALLAVLVIGFVADLALIGALRHARDQDVNFGRLRLQLAEATAPVGQTGADGALLPLGTPVAVLTVPRLGMREVVVEGTTSRVLAAGPGHRRDTVLPGQAGTSVLLGRRAAYGGPFRTVDQLSPGDVVDVTNGLGEHRYRVTGVRRPGDPQPAPPAPGTGRLTLVTATGRPYVPEDVLRVDAELVTPVQPTGARVLSAAALPGAEEAMGTDGAALLPLVLWGQLLLLAAAAVTWAAVRWGRWQSWVAGAPVLLALGMVVADHAAGLLPNLL